VSETTEQRWSRLAAQPFEQVGTPSGFFRGSFASIRDIVDRRQLLSLLVRRELRSRYKDSSLGFLWSLARPLTQLFIYFVVIGQFLGAAHSIPDFAIYVFTGLAAYTLFLEIVGSSTVSIVANSGLVKKVYFPRELFPLASVGSSLFNFGIQFLILVIFASLTGHPPITPALVYLIPSFLLIVVYAAAVGIFFAAVNVYLRDAQYLVEVVVLLMMWASPIVYAWSSVRDILGRGWLLEVYTNNPITLAILGFHKAIWTSGSGTPAPDALMVRILVALGIGLVLLFLSQRVFAKLQGNFAQEL
jgi:ABC-2 type transport system permease protein